MSIENDFPEVFDNGKLEKYKGMSREDVAHVLYANISRLEGWEVSRQFTGGTEVTCRIFIPDPPVVDIYKEVDEYLKRVEAGMVVFSATVSEQDSSSFLSNIALTYTSGPPYLLLQGGVPPKLIEYTLKSVTSFPGVKNVKLRIGLVDRRYYVFTKGIGWRKE